MKVEKLGPASQKFKWGKAGGLRARTLRVNASTAEGRRAEGGQVKG